MIAYKLTDQNMQTYGGCQWALNTPKETDGKGNLCGPGWLHYYKSSLLAVLHNPIHVAIDNPRLFRVEAAGEHKHDGDLKSGCTRLTLLEELPLPEVTTVQRIAYGILCAKELCTDPAWNEWADRWLDGTDRTEAAEAEAAAAEAAAAEAGEAWAAAAWAEAWAWAAAATAEEVAEAEAWAEIWPAVRAVRVVEVKADLDLQAIAERAMEVS